MQRTKRIPRIGTAPKLIAVVVAAMIAASACAPLQLGAAATYSSGQRISQAQLTAESANLSAGYDADQAKIRAMLQPGQQWYSKSDIARATLTWLLKFAIADRAAEQAGVLVTPHDIQIATQHLQALALRQGASSLAEFAVMNGIPPDLLPRLGRFEAIYEGLAAKKFGGVSSSTAGPGFQTAQCQAAKTMDIAVNPQYGALLYSNLVVVPTASELSSPPGGSNLKPPSAPQFQPSC